MYTFYSGAGTVDTTREKVGFAYSTMHVMRKAQKVADDLQQLVIVELDASKAFYAKVEPTPEFNVGDEVTFQPYEKPCKCVVKGYDHFGDRLFYILSGEAISKCTGRSIVESKMYAQYFDEGVEITFNVGDRVSTPHGAGLVADFEVLNKNTIDYHKQADAQYDRIGVELDDGNTWAFTDKKAYFWKHEIKGDLC